MPMPIYMLSQLTIYYTFLTFVILATKWLCKTV